MKIKQNKIYSNEIPLDHYEKELKQFLDKEKFQSNSDFSKTKHMLEEAAKSHIELQESKSVTLRIKKQNLIRIKVKAIQNNIPYQTLINLLINNYAEGKTRLIL